MVKNGAKLLKKDLSSTELQLLDFSLLELLILQNLLQMQTQTTRYKLMHQIRQMIGEKNISTAKFYRILAKLESKKLVSSIEGNPPLYFITADGVQALGTSKVMLGQIGSEAMSFFADKLDDIMKFSRYHSGKVLFVDFSKLYDLVMIRTIKQLFDEFFIVSSDYTYKWIAESIKEIQQSRYVNATLKEPDNSYDLIILFYPGLNNDAGLLHELYRCLKSSAHIIIIDSINPIDQYDHFAIDILLKMWPFNYNTKKSISQIETELLECFHHDFIDKLTLKGLELRLYQKD